MAIHRTSTANPRKKRKTAVIRKNKTTVLSDSEPSSSDFESEDWDLEEQNEESSEGQHSKPSNSATPRRLIKRGIVHLASPVKRAPRIPAYTTNQKSTVGTLGQKIKQNKALLPLAANGVVHARRTARKEQKAVGISDPETSAGKKRKRVQQTKEVEQESETSWFDDESESIVTRLRPREPTASAEPSFNSTSITDEFYLTTATNTQLKKLKKDNLERIAALASTDSAFDPASLTKVQLVDIILSVRQDSEDESAVLIDSESEEEFQDEPEVLILSDSDEETTEDDGDTTIQQIHVRKSQQASERSTPSKTRRKTRNSSLTSSDIAEDDFEHATSKTLLRRKRDELIQLCEERNINKTGTKKELVEALLEWRDTPPAVASTPPASTDRFATPRPRRRLRRSQASSDDDVPLLLRSNFQQSPDKPLSGGHKTARPQKEDDDVNSLDLESLQLQDKEIAPEKLTQLDKVGSGGFKDVYRGKYRNRNVAIAHIRGHLAECDIKELGLLRDLRHPNIVSFIGVSIPKEINAEVPVTIVMELCSNGDLFDYLRASPAPAFDKMVEIMLGIAKGMHYLHTRKPAIIHRDMKSSNVLITSQGVAKISDFGLARVKNTAKSMMHSLVGTVNWQAPELWVPHPKYNEKVDVYSVALVFWEVLSWHLSVKKYPYEGMNEHAIYDFVGNQERRPSVTTMSRHWGREIVELVEEGWAQDASDRPSMGNIVGRLETILAAEKVKKKLKREKRKS